METELKKRLSSIRPIKEEFLTLAQNRLDRLTKPQGSLGQLEEMAKECFSWICARHQMKVDKWHARLIMLKNTAYACRQMVFFLALLPEHSVSGFLKWANDHLAKQPEGFRNRFSPVLRGLALAADGCSPNGKPGDGPDARSFLGWSKAKHWLLADV
jgi:hypothetical protein